MAERAFSAAFMRGGTSKALMFRCDDLPAREQWDAIFMGAIGSPDPYGRQLNGMGGGLSSLSKVCVVGRSDRADAEVDYTFAQILIDQARVDYSGNCGNMSAAVGPFAVEEGLVSVAGDQAWVRIFNTNTQKIIESRFPLRDGAVVYDGDLAIPGVSGSGAPIELRFLDPGGAITGRLLPTGRVVDRLTTDEGDVEVSLVDAANACAFVRAQDVGLTGDESPATLEAHADALGRLADLRCRASVAMGIAPDLHAAVSLSMVPFIAVVSPARSYVSLDGAAIRAADYDLSIRVISNRQPHRASPLTVALCAAVTSRMPGSLLARLIGKATDSRVRLGTPSGVLIVGADVFQDASSGAWDVRSGAFFRTARRLFEGRVWSRS